MQALWFLHSLDRASVIYLFWYTIIFEIPRYTIGTVIVITARLWVRAPPPPKTDFKLSVILAGHNEERPLRPCIEGLAEQTILADLGAIEVVVIDDGSTDRMLDVRWICSAKA
jgi:poly-beta-1,6-N-acetyl-D-glucosamine synthase